ncbi:hypothetical protein BJV82DRAFT_17938 [Fennellomyces sp. T-0311]|nr:hypothetical protein BJV82DRAFT_17938 [Fennellomyces sp. T-0311]
MSEEESFSEQMSVDDENMGDAAMVTALKKLRALETLHDIDIGLSDITNDKLVTEQQPKLSTSSVDTENIHLDERPPSKTPSLSHPDSSGDRPADRPSAAKRQRPVVSDIRRCRLPIRSFTLSQEEAAAASAEEKVLNVLRKRQSITDAHWGQGSRLPMFKAMTLPPPQTTTDKKIRRAKSVRLPKETPQTAEKPVRKPLVRSNTTPSSQSSNLLLHKKPRSTTSEKKPGSQPKKIHTKAKLGSPSTSTGSLAKSPTSPSSSAKKRLSRPKVLLSYGAQKGQDEEEPPKKRMSMFRRKCAPGESRTARLMMGISTTGRRHSSTREPSPPKPQESEDKNERRPARLLRFAYGTQEPNGKKRPVSVGSSKIQSEAKKLQPESTQTVPLPKYDMKSRRQSVPAAFNGRKSQNGDDKQVVSNRSAALKGVKVVRVH